MSVSELISCTVEKAVIISLLEGCEPPRRSILQRVCVCVSSASRGLI